VDAVCQSFVAAWETGRPDISAYLTRVTAEEWTTLLRNLLEHEVRTRRQLGEAPSSKDYIDLLPPKYADLVRRVFLDASSVSLASVHEPTPSADVVVRPAASRLGDYRLVRELGRGGMGAVFEAVHLRRGHQVALKTLPTVSPDALHRFKREFRALADVTHPNLVGLRTLERDGAQWFITMDLLDGRGFLSYVRPGGRLDLVRLRAALAQLAAGVMALHARGVVHRDLKPGNVMVTAEGQVVVLDFGLVGELAGETSSLAKVAGTPAYMAPEQAAGSGIGPPADWYAVGVMLYEALAGTKPFSGDVWRLLQDKQVQDAPPLPADAAIPTELAALAMQLLARDPSARPDPLRIAGAVAASTIPTGRPEGAEQLIGREAQLAVLADTLAAVRRGRDAVTAFVRGRSGEGKTSLAEAFLAPLRRDASVVVLSGRCYDRESVPFKALDTLIDALTAHLRSLPDADAALLLPDDIGLLAHLFPVLNRCDVVAKAPRGRLEALDQQQVRQRAFAALRLLLERVGAQTPVVCFVDDLQWGDADSATALFEVLRPPAAPTVLFLGSYRSDEADASPFLTEWTDRQRQNGVDFGNQAASVGPLSLEEATRLVANVVGRDDGVVRWRAVQFHAQTGGNPFLLTELAGCFDPDADAFHATDIHGVLARKLGELPPEAGPLLNAVSVFGQAVELAEAAEAAGLTDPPEGALTRMRNARLLRVVGAKVDTYHDRIRYAILDRMAVAPRQALHRRLAQVIERNEGGLTDEEVVALTEGRTDPGGQPVRARVYDLSYHYDAAGDAPRALAYALAAAAQARAQSALDVASQQYAIARRNADDAPATILFQIARGLAEAFVLLGRYDDARRELELADRIATRPYDIGTVRLLQGDLAFKVGTLAEGIDRLTDGLRLLGIRTPRTRLGLAWGLIKGITVQVFHNLLPWRLHRRPLDPLSDLVGHLIGRLEYCYYLHNTLWLVWASFVGLNRAELLPRSRALAFNYFCHANDMAVLGWHTRADRYYRACIELSRELNDEYVAALGMNHYGLGCLGAARYKETIEKATPGMTAFEKLGDKVELFHAHLDIGIANYRLGRLGEATAKAQWVFESAVRVGDNSVGPLALSLWAYATRGRLPFDELVPCLQVLPGNTGAAVAVATAEGYWHLSHGRSGEALAAFERACAISRSNSYLVAFNSSVLTDLVAALRVHTRVQEARGVADPLIVRRWVQLARWANGLSWILPPERPAALRELALVYEHRGRFKKAWKLAAKSCRIAEQQKARYEYAQSLLVQGRLAKQLGRPGADDQMRDARAEIDRIEAAVAAVIPAQPS
jgi:tetratricopeptide (TPR) repeat protein